jgi:hypothetical protein
MYTSRAIPPMDNDAWARAKIARLYQYYRVESIHLNQHQTLICMINLGTDPKLPVCNNAQWVFSSILNTEFPTLDHYNLVVFLSQCCLTC